MTSRIILPKKNPVETLEALFGYQDQMTFGTNILSATVQVLVDSGIDPDAQDILDGMPVVEDSYSVRQNIIGGLPGVIYMVTCVALTSNGLELARQGYLAILDFDEF